MSTCVLWAFSSGRASPARSKTATHTRKRQLPVSRDSQSLAKEKKKRTSFASSLEPDDDPNVLPDATLLLVGLVVRSSLSEVDLSHREDVPSSRLGLKVALRSTGQPPSERTPRRVPTGGDSVRLERGRLETFLDRANLLVLAVELLPLRHPRERILHLKLTRSQIQRPLSGQLERLPKPTLDHSLVDDFVLDCRWLLAGRVGEVEVDGQEGLRGGEVVRELQRVFG